MSKNSPSKSQNAKLPSLRPMPDLYINHGAREEMFMSIKERAWLMQACENTNDYKSLIAAWKFVKANSEKSREVEENLAELSHIELSDFQRKKLMGLRKKRRIVERVMAGLESRLVRASIELNDVMKLMKTSSKAA